MIYRAIKYILENDTALASALGTDSNGDVKVYPIKPRLRVEPPFCIFSITDQRGNPTKDSISQLDETRITVSVVDKELDNVVTLSDLVRNAMDSEKSGGTYNGEVIHSIDFDSLNDNLIEGYGDRGAISIELDFIIFNEP